MTTLLCIIVAICCSYFGTLYGKSKQWSYFPNMVFNVSIYGIIVLSAGLILDTIGILK